MRVDYIDHMGDDMRVANAARVSYNRWKEEFDESDKSLLRYLAIEKHWTPFAHCIITFRVRANIAVARQLYKHQVGIVENEMSRRYVTMEPEFDVPEVWRSKPGKGQSKQGSGRPINSVGQAVANNTVRDVLNTCKEAYRQLIDIGVAPEQARLVLPMATVTQWIWTGSLYAFIRVCKERLAPDAQQETREVVQEIHKYLWTLYPESMKMWFP